MSNPRRDGALSAYLDRYRAAILFVNGQAEGMEYALSGQTLTFGRGPSADLELEENGVAHDHAVIEFWGDAFVVRDLDPRHPVLVNGSEVCTCELKDGDRLELGEQVLEFVLEPRWGR